MLFYKKIKPKNTKNHKKSTVLYIIILIISDYDDILLVYKSVF